MKALALFLSIAAFAFHGSVPAAFAQSTVCLQCDDRSDIDVLFFGGVMTEGTFPGWTNVPLAAELDDVFLVGAAVNREFFHLGHGFRIGGEIGIAGRFGDSSSGEIWLGPSFRYDGIKIGPVRISLGLVVGLSAVTGPTDIERKREQSNGGDATLLYYMGPEIVLTFDRFPNTEFVFRTHHRSGAKNVSYIPTLGDMPDTSNANLFGVRYWF